MIIVDESIPVGELPPPFPARVVEVKLDEDIRDTYDLKKEIGRGRFGTVYLCSCKKNGLNFAAKFVNTKRKQDRKNVEREIEIMKILSDKNAQQRLIQLYDAFDMDTEMCLVLEIVEGGELFERVTDDDFDLTERACAIFIRQICQGIEYVHSKNILHLDMKPENILCLSREGNRVKICDFGLARKYDPRKKLQVLFGTPEFVAPEVVNFEPISFGTDMWSIGVICYVLLSGLSPFMGHNYVETMTNVTHNKYDFDDEAFDEVSDEAKDFIERLLILDKSSRMTPEKCFHHPWIQKIFSSRNCSKHEEKEIDKFNLKKYNCRRRWYKAKHTITALKRMGAIVPNHYKSKYFCQDYGNKIVPHNSKADPYTPYVNKNKSKLNIISSCSTVINKNKENCLSQNVLHFQRCHSIANQHSWQNDTPFAKTMVNSQSSNQINVLQEHEYFNDAIYSNTTQDNDVTNVINFSRNGCKKYGDNKSYLITGNSSSLKNTQSIENYYGISINKNALITSPILEPFGEKRLNNSHISGNLGLHINQLNLINEHNSAVGDLKSSFIAHITSKDISRSKPNFTYSRLDKFSSQNSAVLSKFEPAIKSSHNIKSESVVLVDILLNQFKSDTFNHTALRSTKKRDKNSVISKKVFKPYINITTDGLPKNSGSVREMAKNLTTISKSMKFDQQLK